jgi:hypothetical protein
MAAADGPFVSVPLSPPSEGPGAPSRSRSALIARYTELAERYQRVLDERDQIAGERRSLELEVASINKQKARLLELLASAREEKARPE